MNIDIQKAFNEQLEKFKIPGEKDTSYNRYHPLGDKVLIRLFKFTLTNASKDLGVRSILIPSPLDGKWKPREEAINEKIFPICRVILTGSECTGIDVGGLYVVPFNDVVGLDWNPDFMWMMQNFAKQGKSSGQLVIPDDMPQKITKLEKNWERYKFSMPDRVGREEEFDELVYLIPRVKLEAKYTP